MKSLKYLYITALLSSGASLFAQGEVVLPEETEAGSTALVIDGAVHDQYGLFPTEYASEALKAVPAYLLKMDASKQLLRLKGEYKKGLNSTTHHMVTLFSHDANKAIQAFMNLDASVQSEILLCAGQEFIKDYLIAINNFNAPVKTLFCLTEKRDYGVYSFKQTAKTEMSGPDDECTLKDDSYLRRTVVEEPVDPNNKIFSWIENLGRYDFAQFETGINAGILATIDMLFRHAEDKGGIEAMATHLAEIFNSLWDSEDETMPAIETILISGEWESMHSAGTNPQRKLDDSSCQKFKGKIYDDMENWNANGCDQPVSMEVAATLQLNYLHALISELDNANRIPLMERINEQGGLESVLNNEICLSAEEDYFPFVEDELLGKMFEICEKYMYADEIIEALQNEGQYLTIQG